MEETSTAAETKMEKLPKNTKATRYYYKNREKVLERQRLARLAKKGVDITKLEDTHTPLEERRKKKMEFLGLVKTEKKPCEFLPVEEKTST